MIVARERRSRDRRSRPQWRTTTPCSSSRRMHPRRSRPPSRRHRDRSTGATAGRRSPKGRERYTIESMVDTFVTARIEPGREMRNHDADNRGDEKDPRREPSPSGTLTGGIRSGDRRLHTRRRHGGVLRAHQQRSQPCDSRAGSWVWPRSGSRGHGALATGASHFQGACARVIGVDPDSRCSANPTLDEFHLMVDGRSRCPLRASTCASRTSCWSTWTTSSGTSGMRAGDQAGGTSSSGRRTCAATRSSSRVSCRTACTPDSRATSTGVGKRRISFRPSTDAIRPQSAPPSTRAARVLRSGSRARVGAGLPGVLAPSVRRRRALSALRTAGLRSVLMAFGVKRSTG